MVSVLQNYRYYLLANPFVFYTHHQELKYLVNKPLHHGIIVDVFITSECIHLFMLCNVTRCLFQDVSVM